MHRKVKLSDDDDDDEEADAEQRTTTRRCNNKVPILPILRHLGALPRFPAWQPIFASFTARHSLHTGVTRHANPHKPPTMASYYCRTAAISRPPELLSLYLYGV